MHNFIKLVFVDLVPKLILCYCIENKCSELTCQTSRDLLINLILHLSFVRIFNESSFCNGRVIGVKDLCYQHFRDGHLLLESTVANLVSNLEDLVLKINASVHGVLASLSNLLFLGFGDDLATLILLENTDLLPLERLDEVLGGASLPVEGLKGVNQELEEHVHLLSATDNQINITVSQLKSDAIPRVEGNRVDFVRRHGVNVLPVDPEAGGQTAIDEAHDILEFTAGARFDVRELQLVQVFVQLRGKVVHGHLGEL